MAISNSTPDPDPIIAHADHLSTLHVNAEIRLNNPELAYPDWPADTPLPDLGQRLLDAETEFLTYLAEHRDRLSGIERFRHDYGLLDWLSEQGADLQDYHSWSGDPEEPLRRADRRPVRER